MKKVSKKIIQFWPVLLLLVVCFLFLYFFSRLGTSESFNVVLGISLGVLLGFLADISKRTFDDISKKETFRKSVLRLLEQDAKSVYTLFENFKGMIESAGQPNTPEGIEHAIPPNIEMRYWDKFSQRDDFLLLATEDPFSKIFRRFWEFEKLNKLIHDAQNVENETQKKNSGMFAYAISRQVLKGKDHEYLLGLFLNTDELEEYKKTWRRKQQ